jgi:hypothetical protein
MVFPLSNKLKIFLLKFTGLKEKGKVKKLLYSALRLTKKRNSLTTLFRASCRTHERRRPAEGRAGAAAK